MAIETKQTITSLSQTIPAIAGIDDPSKARMILYQAGRPVHAPLSSVGLASASDLAASKTVRNRIINSCFSVSQENGSTAIASGYPADQWTYSGTTGTVQRVSSQTPNGSLYRLRVTTAGATPLCWLFQHIEGSLMSDLAFGTATAKSIIVRFGMKAPAGIYGLGVRNGVTPNRCYSTQITVTAENANVDVEYTVSIPGDTTGTWATDNTGAFSLFFHFANTQTATPDQWVASGYSAPIGMRATTVVGDIYEIYDIGLYRDEDGSGIAPRWEAPNGAEELRACQRYFHKVTGSGFYVGTSATITNYFYKTSMRSTAAITGAGAGVSVSVSTVDHVQLNQTTAAYQTLSFSARL